LRIKYQEIPKADADVLTAGLRGNPLVFASADEVPYGSYSPQRPGENGYGVTVIQPIDINHKRDLRIAVAQRAKRVLEAQYQDAVRLEIGNLYTAYTNVLAARETVRYLEASVAGLDELMGVVERQIKGMQTPVTTLTRLQVQRKSAALALLEAQSAHVKAKHALAMLLNLSIIDEDRFAIRAQLIGPQQELPALDDLTGIALANRPDLIAYHLGVQRAQADVGLAQKEAFPDVFVLYTPWGYRNNAPTGGQNATSWSMGAMFAVPIFNKNQGNIRRAQINVAQTRTELTALERKVETEVHAAYQDALTARSTVTQIETEILPTARSIQDQTLKLFKIGEVSAVEYLAAVREYSEVVRQYRDALVNQRRADLHLNTVIALRVVF
jgi:cobalt-zinc-cadmium efflux system outer membrane protein